MIICRNSYDDQIRKESSEFFVFLLIFDLLDLFFDRSQIFVIYVSSWDDYGIVVTRTMMKLGNVADIRPARFIFRSIANFCNMCFELRWLHHCCNDDEIRKDSSEFLVFLLISDWWIYCFVLDRLSRKRYRCDRKKMKNF